MMSTLGVVNNFGLSCLMVLGTAATMNGQDKAAVASSINRVFASQIGNGGTTTPWTTVLQTVFDAAGAKDKALIVQTSTITGLFSGDLRLSQETLLLENAGIQGRVLIDCVMPSCDGASNTVPAANLAAPGVITLDQAFHFLLQLDAGSFSAALDATAGARTFNFYRLGIGKMPKNDHTIQFQVRFMVDAASVSNGFSLNGVLAGIGKRTMIVDTAHLDLDEIH